MEPERKVLVFSAFLIKTIKNANSSQTVDSQKRLDEIKLSRLKSICIQEGKAVSLALKAKVKQLKFLDFSPILRALDPTSPAGQFKATWRFYYSLPLSITEEELQILCVNAISNQKSFVPITMDDVQISLLDPDSRDALILQLKADNEEYARRLNRLELDNAALRAENVALRAENVALRAENAALRAHISDIEQNYAELSAKIDAFIRK